MVPNFKKHEEPNMSFLKGKTAIITGAGYAVLSDGRVLGDYGSNLYLIKEIK